MPRGILLLILALGAGFAASRTLADESAQATPAAAPQPPAPAQATTIEVPAKDLSPEEQREQNKQGVLRRLQELFKRSAKPVVPKNPIVPQAPYIKAIPAFGDRVTLVYRCRFVKSKTIIDALETIVSASGTVEDSPDQNIVVINDVKDKAEDIKKALLALDIPLPQILVEAQVVELLIQNDLEKDVKVQYTKYDATKKLTTTYGYDLSAPSSNTAMDSSSNKMNFFPYASGSADGSYSNFNIAASLLALSRDAKVLSSPNMIVDLNTTASMITGEDVPIQSTAVTSGTVTTSTYFKRIGVKLNVTPTLINRDIVQLEVNPEVSSIASYQTFKQDTVEVKTPVIAVRNIKSRLSATDGQVIMLGGLYSNEKITEENKVPFFGDIPLFGEAFNSKYQTNLDKQLIFFLKIHILQSPDSVLLDPENRAHEIRDIGRIIHNSDAILPSKPRMESNPLKPFDERVDDAIDRLFEEEQVMKPAPEKSGVTTTK